MWPAALKQHISVTLFPLPQDAAPPIYLTSFGARIRSEFCSVNSCLINIKNSAVFEFVLLKHLI